MSIYPSIIGNPQRQQFDHQPAAVPPPPPPITLRCSCSCWPPNCSRRIRPRPWTPRRWSPRWCRSTSSVTWPASIRFCRAAALQAPPATSAKPRALQQITQPALRPPARAAPLPPAPASRTKYLGRQLMPNFSIPLSGLNASDTALATISNNLANLNTTGYKDTTVNFQDMFYQPAWHQRLGRSTPSRLGSLGRLDRYQFQRRQCPEHRSQHGCRHHRQRILRGAERQQHLLHAQPAISPRTPTAIWSPPTATKSWAIPPPTAW